MELCERQTGFTLLEIIVVLSIISLLAFMAIPSQSGRYQQIKLVETIELVEPYKANIETSYRLTGQFPKGNAEASIPEPEKIIGNYLKQMTVEQGAMHLLLGQKLKSLQGQIVTIFPVYVEGSMASPISWICGYGNIPTGMKAAGENKTTVQKANLPLRCR